MLTDRGLMVIKNFIQRMLTKNPLVRKIKYLQKGGGKRKKGAARGLSFMKFSAFLNLFNVMSKMPISLWIYSSSKVALYTESSGEK